MELGHSFPRDGARQVTDVDAEDVRQGHDDRDLRCPARQPRVNGTPAGREAALVQLFDDVARAVPLEQFGERGVPRTDCTL